MSYSKELGSASVKAGGITGSYQILGGTDQSNFIDIKNTLDKDVVVLIPLDDATEEEYSLAAGTSVSLPRDISGAVSVRFATEPPTSGELVVKFLDRVYNAGEYAAAYPDEILSEVLPTDLVFVCRGTPLKVAAVADILLATEA